MPASADGLTVVVKRDCPTCVLVEPVLQQLKASGARLEIVSQDDPSFPEGAGPVTDDRELRRSWDLKIETVPTLLKLESGQETARAIGWDRTEWEAITGLTGLGPSLPAQRPGCGSITVDPNVADELALKFGNFAFKARKVEIGAWEDEHEAAFDRDWSTACPSCRRRRSGSGGCSLARGVIRTRFSDRCRPTTSPSRSRRWPSTP
jgi:thiol-disulfide isomerase/thioredoxin